MDPTYQGPTPNRRVRFNIERTSTGKYRIDKTVELSDLNLIDPIDRGIAEDTLAASNDLIMHDLADLERKYRVFMAGGSGDDE